MRTVLASLFCLAFLTPTNSLLGQQQSFVCEFPGELFSTETSSAVDISNGDFDQDGDLDVVLLSRDSDLVALLLNDGYGKFESTSQPLPTGQAPMSVTVADFDNDGNPDIATANRVGNSVSILFGLGTAQFSNQVEYPSGGPSRTIRSQDLDLDGDIDLFLSTGANVAVLLNEGDGTFAPFTSYPVGSFAIDIDSGDLNGDDQIDLISANQNSDDFAVLLNQGDGTFSDSVSFAVEAPTAIKLADLDADNDLDVAITRGNTSDMVVYFNNGQAVFSQIEEYDTILSADRILAGDFDDDDDVDLLAASTLSRRVHVFLNSGDGNLSDNVQISSGAGLPSIGDFDGDFDLDFVLADTTIGNDEPWIRLLENSGAGIFESVETISSTSANPIQIVPCDLDGDSDNDFAIIFSDGLSIVLSDEDSFGDAVQVPLPLNFPVSMSIRDFDNDGDEDIVIGVFGGNLLMLTNDGNANFETEIIGDGFFFGLSRIRSEDLNADGNWDLVVLGDDEFRIYLGNGDGTLELQSPTYLPVVGSSVFVLADIDADSDFDMVSIGENNLTTHINDGTGQFQILNTIPLIATSPTMALGDFDFDQRVDLAVLDEDAARLFVFMNEGSGNLGLPTSTDLDLANGSNTITRLLVADVNRDNLDDILLTESQLKVMTNLGDGTFSEPSTYLVPSLPRALAAVDINSDFNTDVLVASTPPTKVSVMQNNCILLGDLNLDGVFDLLDVSPFIELLANGGYQLEGDVNQDGQVDLMDVVELVDLLTAT